MRLIGIEFSFESVEAAEGFGVTVEPVDAVLVALLQRPDGLGETIDLRGESGVFGAGNGLPVHQGVVELRVEVAALVAGGAALGSRPVRVVGPALFGFDASGEPVDRGAGTPFGRLRVRRAAGLQVVATGFDGGELATSFTQL